MRVKSLKLPAFLIALFVVFAATPSNGHAQRTWRWLNENPCSQQCNPFTDDCSSDPNCMCDCWQ